MTARQKSIVAAVSGAVVAGSIAYALGAQAGGGSAVGAVNRAASPQSNTAPVHWRGPGGRFGRDRGAMLEDLAKKLGVSADALRAAFEAVRDELPKPGNERMNLSKALADALGIEEAKVSAALGRLRGGKREKRGDLKDAFIASLAKAMGVDTAKLRDALAKVRSTPGDKRDRGDFTAALAKELGISEDKVESALRSARPARPGRPGPGRPGLGNGALAKELGVTEDQLTAAFGKLRDQAEQQAEQRYNAFTDALAKRLKLDVAEVRAALKDFGPGPWFGPGPGERGPRGPHGFGHP